jgi:hypothetical protein
MGLAVGWRIVVLAIGAAEWGDAGGVCRCPIGLSFVSDLSYP